MHLLRCCPGLSAALAAELARAAPHHTSLTSPPAALADDDTWLQVEGVPPLPRLAFCRQALPDASPVLAASINQWADLLRDTLTSFVGAESGGDARLRRALTPSLRPDASAPRRLLPPSVKTSTPNTDDTADAAASPPAPPAPPWRLHVFGAQGVSRGRVGLIEAALDERLQRKHRALRRARVTDTSPWRDGEWLLQLLLTGADTGWLSCCPPTTRAAWGDTLSPFPGGEVEIPRDPAPPSRAYQKLLEAEQRLGCAIRAGEQCVDLGASPGGWTYIALQRGASVTAIDRSPLREDLMRNPRLHFVRGDAFAFAPERPVDWLLCDVIAFPPKTIAAIERWLTQRWCRRFCVTIKFKGRDDDAALDALKASLLAWAPDARWSLRHLDHNHNEVTLFGTFDP